MKRFARYAGYVLLALTLAIVLVPKAARLRPIGGSAKEAKAPRGAPTPARSISPASNEVSSPVADSPADGTLVEVSHRSLPLENVTEAELGTIARQTRSVYTAPLRALGLSEDDLEIALSVIAERAAALMGGNRAANDQGIYLQARKDYLQSIRDAYEGQLTLGLSSEAATQVRRLLAMEEELSNVSLTFRSPMASIKAPLSGDAEIRLAELMKAQITDPERERDFDVNRYREYRLTGYDQQSGLSEPDRLVLANIAPFVTSNQLGVIQATLSKSTQVFLTSPKTFTSTNNQ